MPQERMMEKLKLHTPDLTAQNIEKLAQLFPNCATEVRDDEGRVTQAIDFDQLRQELSSSIVDGPRERYHLDWPGKREAILAANAPIAKTLRPCRDESVDFDTTKNLFIEGDNLDALKLLQETYLGKVKLIYIDPPYNTGNDFIYEDDFAEDSEAYLLRSNQKDETGNRLVANTEANGRFHSDWLTMMYSRLRLARNFLRDDGSIYISVDDKEVHNLRKMCDEVFGEGNFVGTFIWEKRTNRENRKVITSRHDNLVCYCRDSNRIRQVIRQLAMTDKALANYKNPDDDTRGRWKSDPATAQAGHGTKDQFYVFIAPNGKKHELESGRCWVYTESVMKKEVQEGKIWFGRDGNGVPRVKTYLDAKERGLTPETIWFAEDVATNEIAKNLLKEMFGGKSVFDTPKPVDLVKRIIELSSDPDSIVLDFFAGAAVTAHAVFEANKQDGGSRRVLLVQLPEPCPVDSDAYKAGFQTISDVAKERIRRAGKLLQGSESAEGMAQQTLPLQETFEIDAGFRVLKIDTSNMRKVYYAPDAVQQADLMGQVDNIRADRTPEDLLFQILVDEGLDLALPITEETVAGKTIFFVDGNALAACFDGGVSDELVKEIAKRKPLRAVFRDASYGSDSVKINVDQIFRLLSPETEVRSL
jgi:adenine-specific DNA-methyltransferase